MVNPDRPNTPVGCREPRQSSPRAIRRSNPEEGQGVVEYGLILGLTGAFTAIILGVFGGIVADVLRFIGQAIDTATGG